MNKRGIRMAMRVQPNDLKGAGIVRRAYDEASVVCGACINGALKVKFAFCSVLEVVYVREE
jgi:hypothetical protein